MAACVDDGVESKENRQFADSVLSDDSAQLRSGSSASEDSPSASERFHADFNGDGYSDLVIGVTFESIEGMTSGAVNVLYGTDDGLHEDDDQFWHQDSPGILGVGGEIDRFSEALAVGDFDNDGYDDLAIGAPQEDIYELGAAGAVNVFYGSEDGLSSSGDQLWHQDSPGIADLAEDIDHFASALTSGDFDGDGYDDLAIGAPLEDVKDKTNAGMVHLIYGSANGLSAGDDQVWTQDSPGIEDSSAPFEFFGQALAAGDFDADGYDDLAIGVDGEDIGSLTAAGSVNLLYGAANGLSASRFQSWNQDTPKVEGLAESRDFFGGVLSVGDFDCDGYEDLAIGVPSEDIGRLVDAGAVNLLYGSGKGLRAARSQFWHQNSASVRGLAEPYDQFGYALAAGDFDGDGCDDLAIGAPFDDLSEIDNGGLVNVLYGALAEGLSGSDDQLWHQNVGGIKEVAESSDEFGFSLAAGDYDGDGEADLAIGVPGEDHDSLPDAGALNLIYGGGSGLKTPGDQVWHQDTDGVDDEAEAGDAFGYTLR